jgi:Kef-type K+ transport system membrane component KefB
MPNVSFVGLLIVALVAFLAPLLLGLSPARRLPWVVLEIVAGIVIGPSVLGWVRIDLAISILSVIGLAFLLFLAGMAVELERLRGRQRHVGRRHWKVECKSAYPSKSRTSDRWR